jgi:integrase
VPLILAGTKGNDATAACPPFRPIELHLQVEFTQQKTGQPVRFEITEQTREAIERWILKAQLRHDRFLFPSRKDPAKHITTRQYGRIVKSWVNLIGLDPTDYATHSLRRTKATLIYRRTKNLRAVQILLGHTKIESTVRYLGIEVDDALEMAEQTEI